MVYFYLYLLFYIIILLKNLYFTTLQNIHCFLFISLFRWLFWFGVHLNAQYNHRLILKYSLNINHFWFVMFQVSVHLEQAIP